MTRRKGPARADPAIAGEHVRVGRSKRSFDGSNPFIDEVETESELDPGTGIRGRTWSKYFTSTNRSLICVPDLRTIVPRCQKKWW